MFTRFGVRDDASKRLAYAPQQIGSDCAVDAGFMEAGQMDPTANESQRVTCRHCAAGDDRATAVGGIGWQYVEVIGAKPDASKPL